MEAMKRGMVQLGGRQAPAQARGLLGTMSERTAQVVALLITLLSFGGLAYGINALFTALGQ